jgi:PAS domain S-box-containing protein
MLPTAELLRTLMDHVPDRIYFKDLAGRFVRVNRTVAQRFGLDDPAKAIGKTDADFFSTEAAEAFAADEREVLRTGQALVAKEDREVWPDGRITWASTTTVPLIDPRGAVVGVIGVSRDITDRKQAEEALSASEARYQALVENLTQSVFLKDAEFRFVAVNQPFCRGLGLAEAEILGKTDFEIYPPPLAAKYRADDAAVLTRGVRLEQEEQNVIAGQMRTIHVIKTPFRDAHGRIVGVLGSFWDVTEQRRVEAQLRQAQKMEALGQLAGGVAHDFNNLLTAILGNLSLVLAEVPAEAPTGGLLREAERAASRAAALTQQLLSFTRQAVLRLESINLGVSMHEVAGLLRRTIDPRIGVEVRSEPGLWLVQADAAQVTQVLMNLCLNARDAMPEGGRLLLEAENAVMEEVGPAPPGEARPGTFVRLRVSDTGNGIPPDIRARIFEPFFTTKDVGKGTGLGLAIVYGIVKQHHGWVECHSKVGQGTTFTIYLPRDDKPQGASAAESRPVVASGGGETILLIDDEALVRNLGRVILERHGYRVLLAEDGLQAIEIYQREQGRIDLVILDLLMPRLSGRDTFHQLRAINPNVRTLFSSGYSSEQASLSTEAGIHGFVTKPYYPRDLVESVRAILDQPAG